MGYLHKINRRSIHKMIDRKSPEIYINIEYQSLMKEYLSLFVARQVELFGLGNNGGKFSGTGGKGLVKRLYEELVRIVDTKQFGRFKDWVENYVDADDYEDVYCLYQAVYNVDRYGMYSAQSDGDNVIVSSDMGEEELVLRGSSEQQEFLDYLDDTYGEEVGIESLYSFNKAMEKDD